MKTPLYLRVKDTLPRILDILRTLCDPVTFLQGPANRAQRNINATGGEESIASQSILPRSICEPEVKRFRGTISL